MIAVKLTRNGHGFRFGPYWIEAEAVTVEVFDTRLRKGGFNARTVARLPSLVKAKAWLQERPETGRDWCRRCGADPETVLDNQGTCERCGKVRLSRALGPHHNVNQGRRKRWSEGTRKRGFAALSSVRTISTITPATSWARPPT